MSRAVGEADDAAPASAGSWPPAPSTPRLSPGEADVWRIRPASPLGRVHEFLSADERRRASGLRFPRDQRNYATARGALRDILARYSVNDPADLLFRRGTHGKPVLSRGNLRFNLSHAGDSALVAVSIGAEVGVDLERVRRNLRCVELAERLFTPDESRSVATAQDPVEVFFRLWTCKESYLKCLGYGLKRPLDTFRVRLAEHGGPASLTARGGSPLGWSVTELRPWNDFAAAITVEGEAAAVHQWTWPGSDQLVVGSIQCLRRSKG